MEKKCSRCKEIKSINEFWHGTAYKDGHVPWCKTCVNEYKRLSYPEHRQQIQNANKKYIQTDNGITAKKRAGQNYYKNHSNEISSKLKQYRQEHPERHQAQNAVAYAVHNGRLLKANFYICSNCNDRKAEHWHHYLGYAKEHWLDVIPVCNKCHALIHSTLQPIV